jgi:hypothetical protein
MRRSQAMACVVSLIARRGRRDREATTVVRGHVSVGGHTLGESVLAEIRDRVEWSQGYAVDLRPDVTALDAAVEAVFEIHVPSPLRHATGYVCARCHDTFPCSTRVAATMALIGRAANRS